MAKKNDNKNKPSMMIKVFVWTMIFLMAFPLIAQVISIIM